MADFIRSLLQVLLGFILGVATMLYVIPANKASKAPTPAPATSTKVVLAPKSADTVVATEKPAADPGASTLFGRRAPSEGEEPAPRPEVAVAIPPPSPVPAKPEPVVVTPVPAPVAPPVAAVEEPVDFRELCIKPAAWPPIVTLNKEINAQVMQGEEVIAEIPLSAGEKLQVSKVFGDGTAEVRAKGAKFTVKAADTDLAAQARVRLAEISGRPRPPATAAAPVAEPAPARVTPTPPAPATPQQPARGSDLDSKMRSLFGTPEKR